MNEMTSAFPGLSTRPGIEALRHAGVRAAMLLITLLAPVADADVLTVGPILASDGEIISGTLIVPESDDEGASIPITIVNGAEPGPVVAFIAGIHGYEYAPVVALQRIRAEIDPSVLRGTVIIVHVANPASFYARTISYNPVAGMNLNRAFPGDPYGSHSERIAHALTTEVIERADFVVDMHAGDGNEALRPFIYMPEVGDTELDAGSRRLALAFGLDHIVIDRSPLRDADDSLYVRSR